jgi:[ribosomal protein S18]-alanine N-acetyltransferase
MLVRSADVSDVADLAALDRLLFDGEDRYTAATWRQLQDLGGPLLHVAVAEARVVGYTAVVRSGQDPAVGWLTVLGVDPHHRRSGVGTQLTQRVLNQAWVLGIDEVRLTVAPANNPARRLYEQQGFRVDHHQEGYFPGPDGDRLVMVSEHPTVRAARQHDPAVADLYALGHVYGRCYRQLQAVIEQVRQAALAGSIDGASPSQIIDAAWPVPSTVIADVLHGTNTRSSAPAGPVAGSARQPESP